MAPPPRTFIYERGEGGGGSTEGQLYANIITEWPLITFYYKIRQVSLQNAIAILLQNATEVYYKMCQVFYYKLQQYTHASCT